MGSNSYPSIRPSLDLDNHLSLIPALEHIHENLPRVLDPIPHVLAVLDLAGFDPGGHVSLKVGAVFFPVVADNETLYSEPFGQDAVLE